jgi:VCBS repeat-containing protein
MNLFTGDKALAGVAGSSSGAAASSTGSSSSGGSGSTTTAAYDISRPSGIPQIVEKSSPAVVLVESFVKQQSRSSRGGSMLDDPFFRYFFGDGGGSQQQPNKNNNNNGSGALQQAGIGSGFIFDQTGYILTNEHVIDGADEVRVKMEGSDKEYTAKVVGSSYDYDLAVLKIDGNDSFPFIPIGDSSKTAIGDWVVAIGNPLGFDHTVTVGVLSAKERPIDIPDQNGTREYKHLLQTDASINPGNSGGPLLNMNGEVIGINTAVSSDAQGIGFAIPTSTINELLPNLKTGAKIPKPASPYVGVTLSDISANYQKALGLSSTEGTVVMSVVPGGPAFKAGVKQYDTIIAANGEKVANTEALRTKIQALKVGDAIKLTVIRDGKQQDINVTIGDQNNDPDAQLNQ